MPSELLGLERAGIGEIARLAFDLGAVSFFDHFERARDEMEPVPPEERERKPKKPVELRHKYKDADLMRMLDIDPADEDAKQILDSVVPPEAWDAWADDEEA